jgi:hypothetical protein
MRILSIFTKFELLDWPSGTLQDNRAIGSMAAA